MKREVSHFIRCHPGQFNALLVTDHRIKRFLHIGNKRGVGPDAKIQDAHKAGAQGSGRNSGFLRGLTHGTVLGGLPLVPGPARERPGAPVVDPGDPVLEQDPACRVMRQQAGGTEPAPVPLPVRGNNPGIPRVAWSVRAAWLSGSGRFDPHLPYTATTRACGP